ncbi:phosphatidylserine decarboxylase [Streptomyces telluris]|uniref:Phosphatidylserine decarboxylase n=1 Tax=Streptomyces telluris TaxID=2720021 RepID=A0A9X2LIH3_9ACTN|nr:phosphatidylserine decarboxylase [Streptomyces telluris]MCQ8771949.1 phosphatidylserine decarboxylase [Streptomyces telluris]
MTQHIESYSETLEDFLGKIRRWFHNDHKGFKTLYCAAVQNVVPYPDDTPEEVRCDWKDQGIDFLCQFFTDWYNWQPGVHNGLDYIEKFSWLNYENDYGMVFVTCGPGYEMTADFTHLQGLQMDESGPRAKELINKWVDELGPKRMKDYHIEDWQTFNEFFIREIKKKRRPVDAPSDDSVVVAPADCVINMIVDELTETTPIPVKTVTMNVRQLLGDSGYADRFIGGTAVSCILMPDSYHRYHAPVAGEAVEARDDIGGVYYGMRDFPGLLDKGDVGYGYDYSMFDDFRRGYVIIRTEYLDRFGRRDGEGYVGLVPVGLNSIASVNFLPKFKGLDEPVRVEKGEEIGNFMYGGSLNILLFEPNRFPALQMLQGQRIGVLEDPERTTGLFSRSYHRPSRRRRPLSP